MAGVGVLVLVMIVCMVDKSSTLEPNFSKRDFEDKMYQHSLVL